MKPTQDMIDLADAANTRANYEVTHQATRDRVALVLETALEPYELAPFELSPDGKAAVARIQSYVDAFKAGRSIDNMPSIDEEQLLRELDRAQRVLVPAAQAVATSGSYAATDSLVLRALVAKGPVARDVVVVNARDVGIAEDCRNSGSREERERIIAAYRVEVEARTATSNHAANGNLLARIAELEAKHAPALCAVCGRLAERCNGKRCANVEVLQERLATAHQQIETMLATNDELQAQLAQCEAAREQLAHGAVAPLIKSGDVLVQLECGAAWLSQEDARKYQEKLAVAEPNTAGDDWTETDHRLMSGDLVLVEPPDEDLWVDVRYLLRNQSGGESRRIADWVVSRFKAPEPETVKDVFDAIALVKRELTAAEVDAFAKRLDAAKTAARREKGADHV